MQAPSRAQVQVSHHERPPVLLGAILLALAAVFLGYDIGLHPITLWDESRVVSNALEMNLSGFGLVTTYGFQPDLWNTKPPLAIWLIAGAVRLLGPSEWVVRLPSLIAALATLGMVMAFTWRLTRSRFTALCAPFLLAFSPGFFGAHAAHTADYDMLLSAFTTGYILLLFEVVHRRRAKAGPVLACALMVAGACLTKGIAGVMPGVGVALYVLARGRWPRIFKSPWYGAGALLVVALVGGYYVLRERAGPGYLAAVMTSELGGRYLHGIKSHVQPPYYYLQVVFLLFAFGPALLALLIAPWLRWPATKGAAFLTYGGWVSVTMLAVFSLSQTKIFWYMAPLYPVVSIMMAIVFDRFLHKASPNRSRLFERPRTMIAITAVVLLALAVRYKVQTLPQLENTPQGRYGLVFAQLDKAGFRHVRAIDDGVVNDEGLVQYAPQLHIYAMAWRERGMDVRRISRPELARVAPEDVVVTCDAGLLSAVRARGPSLTTVDGCAAAKSSGRTPKGA